MNTTCVFLCLTSLAATATAQIPMSKFVRTFGASLTRGYYFQAPVDFTVTALRVPDESGQGRFLVALYQLGAAPPAFTQSIQATPIFYAENVKSADQAVLSQGGHTFKKGAWVAVLGACGNTSGDVYNSYGAPGAANNPSEILGHPIALQRCGMQINIGTTKGIGPIWNENDRAIGRVYMTLKGGAESRYYCGPSAGAAWLGLCDTHPAITGRALGFTMKSGGTGNTGGLLALGIQKQDVNLRGLGRLCVQGIQLFVPLGIGGISALGTHLKTPPIPAGIPLGSEVYCQGVLITTQRTPALTNGLSVKTGR